MPASSFRVPVPVTSGRTGAGTGGKFENFKKMTFFFYFIAKHCCIKPFHIHFVPTALSGALPAFFTVLSAWKLRNVHGVQKASL
ncbi:unnamed protein product [Staurois parvus]|uniref:Uncharacterized protein n=1 Tax=Staurois parvus TaxID=386267 RepID=A0ABN9D4F0_9NEOB|nr:unnamed protein product [Staurois parvus]